MVTRAEVDNHVEAGIGEGQGADVGFEHSCRPAQAVRRRDILSVDVDPRQGRWGELTRQGAERDARSAAHGEDVTPGWHLQQPYDKRDFDPGVQRVAPAWGRLQEVARKSTALVSTVPAVRPGASWYCQKRFVNVMTWSGGGAPHCVESSVVWASLTSVTS